MTLSIYISYPYILLCSYFFKIKKFYVQSLKYDCVFFVNTIHGGEEIMGKRKANHIIEGMNAAKAQGMGAGYNEELQNEPLTAEQRQNNKKRKTNQ